VTLRGWRSGPFCRAGGELQGITCAFWPKELGGIVGETLRGAAGLPVWHHWAVRNHP
jgi:hypothetical protein